LSVFQDWSIGTKLMAAVIAIMTTVIGSALVRAFVTNDDYWLVSRGYLNNDVVAPLRAERNEMISHISKDVTEKLENLEDQYRDLSDNQLANRVGVLELAIVVLNSELTTVEIHLKTNENDIVALGRRLAIVNSLRGAEEQRRLILCLLDKNREVNASCR
jgi:hypothetical protein